MSDIVKRLRAHCTTRFKDTVQTDLLEAIDEIERLRAKIKRALEVSKKPDANRDNIIAELQDTGGEP